MSDHAKLISRRVEFDGWHRLETVTVQPRSLKHDGYAQEMSREILYAGNVAVCLPYLPATDQILLCQQFRTGPFLAGDEQPFLFECCGGFVDEGEAVEDALRRETLEEAGCHITDTEFIAKAYSTPGCSDEAFLIYCGRVTEAEAGYQGLEEEQEEIKTHLLPAADVIRMVDEGKITNASTLIALHWFARNHERLKKKWNRA